MDKYWVYMVLCSDASYYTGITNNVERRVWEHNEGINRHCYTYTRRPVKLVYAGGFDDPNHAITFEKTIKGWGRKKKQHLIAMDPLKVREP